jgi:hypothetical protein
MVMDCDLPLQHNVSLKYALLQQKQMYSRSLVSGGHLHDTVGVNLEGNLDLGDTTRCRRDAGELELAEKVVILSHSTFTLEDLDQHSGLVISGGGEAVYLRQYL